MLQVGAHENQAAGAALTPPAKGKTNTFLIGKELKKTPYTIPRRNGQAHRQQNPTQNQNQTPDSLRQGVRMNSQSESPRISTRLPVRTASVDTQASSRRGKLP